MTRVARIVIALFAAGFIFTLVLPAPVSDASTTATVTRAQLEKRARQLQFSYSLARFIKVKRADKSNLDSRFTWKDNGCSAPSIAAAWSKVFAKSCKRHDFGYRNFGHDLALQSTDAMKRRIDSRLYADMLNQCRHYSGSQGDCRNAAWVFYQAVANFGAAQTAFYARECPKNRFCLFDDRGYEDRRIALKSSVSDMNDLNFGDKASSVKNRANVWWLIYDDHDYDDRALCIKPGVRVADLNSYGFGDKTSSAKPLTASRCPSGSTVVN